MKVKEMELLTDAELRELSLKRSGRNRKYTKDALRAQAVLQARSGRWQWVSREAPSYEVQLKKEQGW